MVRRNRCESTIMFRRDSGFERAMAVSCQLPKNIDDLPVAMRVKCEEDVYRRMMRWKWGFFPGDARLSTMAPESVEKPVGFGKKVDDEADES